LAELHERLLDVVGDLDVGLAGHVVLNPT
jgi:hypothetical protein